MATSSRASPDKTTSAAAGFGFSGIVLPSSGSSARSSERVLSSRSTEGWFAQISRRVNSRQFCVCRSSRVSESG